MTEITRAVEESVWSQAKSISVFERSFWVALVIGSILTVINQYQAIIGDSVIQWVPLVLTYLVPFALSSLTCVWLLRRLQEKNGLVIEEDKSEDRVLLVGRMEQLSQQVLDNASRVNEASGQRANFAEDVLALSTQSAEEMREAERLADHINNSTSEVANRFIDNMDHVQQLFGEITATQS